MVISTNQQRQPYKGLPHISSNKLSKPNSKVSNHKASNRAAMEEDDDLDYESDHSNNDFDSVVSASDPDCLGDER